MSYNSEQTRIAAREVADSVKQLVTVVTELRFQLHMLIATEQVRRLLTADNYHVPTVPRQCPFCNIATDRGSVSDGLDHMTDHIFREYGMPNVTLRPSDRLMLESGLTFPPEVPAKRR